MSDTPRETTSEPVATALGRFRPGDDPIATKLRTSERVLARVTDGIYRQPGSALRELVSNAYDADATRVVVNLDRPRFERITISDDGNGMSPAVLAHVLHNIGGSAKRTELGTRLELTSAHDPNLSPGGRRLIGKIGIGLFSVAQLTQTFQITTKVANDEFSTVATVLLRQYSDTTTEVDEEGHYRAGEVLLWREPAQDVASHGTTITLTSVREQTRETLQSQELWQKIAAALDGQGRPLNPPVYHVGEPSHKQPDSFEIAPKLPWQSGQSPSEAFMEFADSPFEAFRAKQIRTPRYEEIFDHYLAMIWRLGLAVPLPYVRANPFDIPGSSNILFYRASGRAREEAESIHVAADQVLRDVLDFTAPTSVEGFEVQIDELTLKRPIDLNHKQLPTNAALQTPILMVGNQRFEFRKSAKEFSGGPLAFSAYLFWTPKLTPADHAGVLIRVNEASGTLFYRDFLGFPVNEQRRLPQITAEIFISEGFDGALNIDRESFNLTHPHVVTLTRWFHGALRQLINLQKRLGAQAAASRSKISRHEMSERVAAVVDDVWASRQEGADPPAVILLPDLSASADLDTDIVRLPGNIIGEVAGPRSSERKLHREQVVTALCQILLAYDTFDELDDDELADLVRWLFALILEDVK